MSALNVTTAKVLIDKGLSFDQQFALLKKEDKSIDVYDTLCNDLYLLCLVDHIKEGRGDNHLPELLVSEHNKLRIAAQKRVCWLERYK